MVLLAIELLALGRDIHPETSLPADGARALNLEPDLVMRAGARRKVDVVTRNVRRAIVPQRQEVDVLGTLLHGGSHACGWSAEAITAGSG